MDKYKRCMHIMVSGRRCGSPALRMGKYCAFHRRTRQQERKIKSRNREIRFELPVLEDANSIQLALMQVIEMLVAGKMESKAAGMVLYALQTASSNLRRPEFEPKEEEEIGGLAGLLLDKLGIPREGDEVQELENARKGDFGPSVYIKNRSELTAEELKARTIAQSRALLELKPRSTVGN
jgi:hypothetical protein